MDTDKLAAAKEILRKAIVPSDSKADRSKLAGKSVLITGGASGLGAGLTKAFGAAGAWVTVADIKIPDAGPDVVKECIDAGQHVQFVKCDAVSYEQQKDAFRKAVTFNPDRQELDYVCSLAGVVGHRVPQPSSAFGKAGSEPEDPFAGPTAIDISLKGGYYSLLLGLHWLGKEIPEGAENPKDKAIILMGSKAGYTAIPGAGDYSAAKFGLRGLFKSWRAATVLAGVRLNLIAPGFIDTPIIAGAVDRLRAAGHPVGTVEDVVGPVLLCCTDNTISGRALGVGVEGLLDLRDDFEGHDGSEAFDYYASKFQPGLRSF